MREKTLQTKRVLCSVLFILLLSLAGMTHANPVDMHTAREVGLKFMNTNTNALLRGIEDLRWVATYSISRGDAAFYVFNTTEGFVIVAADDCATPILGYSEEGQFGIEEIPVQLQEFLQNFVEQIEYGIVHHLPADETVARQWELVQAIGHLTEQRATTAVAPMLTDTWNQSCYYNSLCPEDSDGPCGHTLAGCAATSFSQIMRYWGYPTKGTGSHTYTPSGYPQQTADFGATTYDWANMPDNLSSTSSSTQIDAVATLMWHCGVAVDMRYGPYGSGADPTDIATALVKYFGYSDELSIVFRSDYSDADWLALIKNCLDIGRPVHYSGFDTDGSVGHGFICDGYNTSDLLHFNWGWGGYCNGYFSITALNPGSYVFTYDNLAIINIHPGCTPGTTFQITAMANPSDGGTISGAGTYSCGYGCTLTATPSEGYLFMNWTQDGEVVSCNASYSFTVTEDAEIEAIFMPLEGNLIGSGEATSLYLPGYSYCCYNLSQQIYTPDEIGGSGSITSVSYFNEGETKTRDYDIYMVHTDKSTFTNNKDWITVTEADRVYSGSVTMTHGYWSTIVFATPFDYDGTSNLALIVDDNSGTCSDDDMACRVFNANGRQAIHAYSNTTNFDPNNPSGISGTRRSVKNQIILGIMSSTAEQTSTMVAGWNWWSTNLEITMEDLQNALVEALPGTSITIKSNRNGQTSYNGAIWMGALRALDVAQMYKISVSADCEIVLEGMPINPAEHPVTIANGANWIGFPLSESLTVTNAFGGFPVNNDKIKSNNNGQATFNGTIWVGALRDLEPGKGYVYKSNASGNRTFTFPIGAK